MKLSIGENIKFIRKSKDITQEALAGMLGVSCQSVSRWELGTCYPDMELLPVIAEIFNISVDKLLGVDSVIEKNKVDEYVSRFQAAINVGQIDECIAIAREGVAEYPNNYVLLNKLMYALFVSGDDDGNIPNWKENMEKYDAEIVSLGERIIKYCPDQDIRLEATGRLAFQHCEMGRKAMGRAIYETLPSQAYCRENQMWWSLEDDEKLPFIYQKIKQDYESLSSNIWVLANSRLLPDEKTIEVIEKYYQLDDLICDGNRPAANWDNSRLNWTLARIYARLEKHDLAYKHLKIAAELAVSFDDRPDEESFSSLLLGEIKLNKSEFETSDTRKLAVIFAEDWMKNPDFDNIRNTEEFNSIFTYLSKA